MNIDDSPAPADFVEALKSEAGRFTTDAVVVSRLTQAKVGIRVVSRTLDDIDSGSFLDRHEDGDRPDVWRFLSRGANGTVTAGEVSRAPHGTPHLVNLTTDPRIIAVLHGLEEGKRYKLANDEQFQVALLRIAGLLLEALWFRSSSGEQYVMPVLSASKELRLGYLYEGEEFVRVVQQLSKRFRQQETPRYIPPTAPMSV